MGQSRRSFLTMLGLAPLVAPAALASAAAPKVSTVRFIRGSAPVFGMGRRILLADEIDAWPAAVLSQGDPLKLHCQARLTHADTEQANIDSPMSSPSSNSMDCPVFIDDAGGGP